MYYYALTIKKTRQPIFLTDYMPSVSLLKKHIGKINDQYCEIHFENTKGLHYHAYISTKRKCSTQSLYKVLKMGWGWRFECEECRNKDAWLQYIRKDHKKEEDLIFDEKMKEVYDSLERPFNPDYLEEEEGETAASTPRGSTSESTLVDDADGERKFEMPAKKLF